MMISVQIVFLLFWMSQDCMRCNAELTAELLTVNLNESVTLNCTYNCSTAFVRACLSGPGTEKPCPDIRHRTSNDSDSCTVSFHLPKVSTKHLHKFYMCYTERTDDPELEQRPERMFLLQLPVQTSTPHLTSLQTTESRNGSLPVQSGESTGIQVLATVSVLVAMILAAVAVYLCVNRQHWICKGEPLGVRQGCFRPPQRQDDVLTPVTGTPSAQSERVTLRIPPPDVEDDTEVPYADIMITVRGVSTPELSQVNYTAAGDQREWWGDDSRALLHASRSADRLHVPQPREVSRKMSTNSEYAIITYA
ncbi:uncharacterized protein LOC115400554 isoform X2 [Salarias fasciatus]|uniref:uncharacterized protein LOC115400554 isoform X2 n=1 Tax=Salarias fasciatus TaxID=181472 RepID=UPI001176B33E|nr:uncharacterized protein LOC115400554 isoform X2 [Salarias fasciatus]